MSIRVINDPAQMLDVLGKTRRHASHGPPIRSALQRSQRELPDQKSEEVCDAVRSVRFANSYAPPPNLHRACGISVLAPADQRIGVAFIEIADFRYAEARVVRFEHDSWLKLGWQFLHRVTYGLCAGLETAVVDRPRPRPSSATREDIGRRCEIKIIHPRIWG